GLKNVAAGANPMGLKRGIENAVDLVVEDLKKQSKEISGKEDIARVATISAREREIGDVIADAIDKAGKDGVVNVEEGQTFGLKLENTKLSQLGRARRVVIDKDATTIIDGAGDSDGIKGRIKQLKAEIENTDSDFDREKLQERLAKLAGGVAVVKVGAATETEMKEKKHRVEDALQAARAASRRVSFRAAALHWLTPSTPSRSTAKRAAEAQAAASV